jgi:S1-C subfamily serine protease
MMTATLKKRLGAEVRPLTAQEAEQYGLNTPSGVVITWIDPKGALGGAGFEVGDALLAINGHPIFGIEGLVALISQIKPHEKATVLAVDHRTGGTGNVLIQMP